MIVYSIRYFRLDELDRSSVRRCPRRSFYQS